MVITAESDSRSCEQGENFVIDEGVEVTATPGHSGADVSLVVQNTTNGTVLVAGKFDQSLICVRIPEPVVLKRIIAVMLLEFCV